MREIPGAKASPRVENGILRWYAGDTFTIYLLLEITDQDGREVLICEEDAIKITFYDGTGEVLRTLSYSGDQVEGNTLAVTVDQNMTVLFPPGRYGYDIAYNHGERTTVARDNKIIVD